MIDPQNYIKQNYTAEEFRLAAKGPCGAFVMSLAYPSCASCDYTILEHRIAAMFLCAARQAEQLQSKVAHE